MVLEQEAESLLKREGRNLAESIKSPWQKKNEDEGFADISLIHGNENVQIVDTTGLYR